MSQNHYAQGALTEGHAHNVVLLALLRSRKARSETTPDTEDIVLEPEDKATVAHCKRCCGEPVGYVRGFPIYCQA